MDALDGDFVFGQLRAFIPFSLSIHRLLPILSLTLSLSLSLTPGRPPTDHEHEVPHAEEKRLRQIARERTLEHRRHEPVDAAECRCESRAHAGRRVCWRLSLQEGSKTQKEPN